MDWYRLRRFLALPPSERRLLVEACALVVWFAVALRVLPFRVVVSWAGHANRDRPCWPKTDPRRIAPLVDAAGGLLRASCLSRALALSRIFESHGVPHELRIGVRRPRVHADSHGSESVVIRGDRWSGIEAHAWVVAENRVLIGRADVGSYMHLTTIPAGRASV